MATRLDSPPPPIDLPDDPHDRGGRDWIELLRAANDIDAALLVGRLEDASVETRTLKDRSAPGAWLYGGSNPWAPVVVFVRRWQLSDARLVLAEVSLNFSSPPPSGRPAGGGTRRTSTLWWATALSLGLVLSALALQQVAGTASFCQLPVLCEDQPPAEPRP